MKGRQIRASPLEVGVIPKQQKWRGWTLNFAHRYAIPTLIV
jgi:hypothetical protein